ncbi:MAG: hypothetical protein U9N55_04375 [candidate division Zixibacteria bacterium]|nr:hypothetical protein [candidate division Zixibacteria bacterium]
MLTDQINKMDMIVKENIDFPFFGGVTSPLLTGEKSTYLKPLKSEDIISETR